MENHHPTVDKIKDLLDQNGCQYEYFEHEAVRTSAEAAATRAFTGYQLHQGAKAIIVRAKEPGKGKRFFMFVVPGDKRFDTAKIEKTLGLKEIRFATEDEVKEVTGGILVGGVPPFGNLFGLEVVADASLLNNERIVFSAGDRCVSMSIKSEDYKKVVNPRVEDIV